MISNRLQHWTIILSAYSYEVKHKPSNQHGNADGLSQLPLEQDTDWADEMHDTVCLLEHQQVKQLPINVAI